MLIKFRLLFVIDRPSNLQLFIIIVITNHFTLFNGKINGSFCSLSNTINETQSYTRDLFAGHQVNLPLPNRLRDLNWKIFSSQLSSPRESIRKRAELLFLILTIEAKKSSLGFKFFGICSEPAKCECGFFFSQFSLPSAFLVFILFYRKHT